MDIKGREEVLLGRRVVAAVLLVVALSDKDREGS